MFGFSFIIFITVVFGKQVESTYPNIQRVQNFDEFNAQLTTNHNVVLIITAQNCEPCSPVLEQVVERCSKRLNVKCFWADIGDSNVANSFYDSQMLNVWWIPYVGFFRDGNKVCAANQKFAEANRKNVNKGFRIFID